MDKLKAYIDGVGQSELAKMLGISRQAVNHWVHGRDLPSVPIAKRLVEMSGGFLRRQDVRPDIYGD